MSAIVIIAIGTMRIGFVRSFNLIAGVLLIIFFPGWWLSFIAFPFSDQIDEENKCDPRYTLDSIERITLAVAISVVVSSVMVFVLNNLPGTTKLNPKNLAMAIILFNIVVFAWAAWRRKWLRRMYALILGVSPFTAIVLDQMFDIITTVHIL